MKHLKTDYRETVHTIELTDKELNRILDSLIELEGEETSALFFELRKIHWNS